MAVAQAREGSRCSIAVIGAGPIGQAIVRRVRAGRHSLLADIRQENSDPAAKVPFDTGFNGSTATVDVSSRALGSGSR